MKSFKIKYRSKYLMACQVNEEILKTFNLVPEVKDVENNYVIVTYIVDADKLDNLMEALRKLAQKPIPEPLFDTYGNQLDVVV